MFKSVAVIGGDLRQITLAKMMAADGYNVTVYGFTENIVMENIFQTDDIKLALDNEIIILPVPVTFDGLYINTPYSENKITIKRLVSHINPLSLVFGGRISKELSDELSRKGVKHRDYMTRDELAIKNAIPTAEGAIAIAMNETSITIHNSKCLVLGYGKVGKILAKSLSALGAKTHITARKYADLALIEGHGYIPMSLNEAKNRLHDFDIIFNTVPALILNSTDLSKVSPDTLIIDLASKPGGVDFEKAKELGIKVIWALSLPGQVAPVTAGIIIKDTIYNMLAEEV